MSTTVEYYQSKKTKLSMPGGNLNFGEMSKLPKTETTWDQSIANRHNFYT